MYHCCQFKADDIYCLEDTDLYSNRTLSVGFCPICNKPVAELFEQSFTGAINKILSVGIHAQNLMAREQSNIVYSMLELNYKRAKSKPYGWKYGINKESKNGRIRQYACDFYGNKELIKK